MIESLIIHRFRGIKKGALKDIGKFNVFVGPNNSGKTALLEMLYLGGVNGRTVELILEGLPSATEETEISFKAAVPIRYDFLGNEPLPRLRERHGHDGFWKENPASLTREGGIAVNLEGLVKKSVMKGFRLAASLEEGADNPNFNEKDIHEIASFCIDKGKNIPRLLIPSFFNDYGIVSRDSYWNYLWENIWVYQRDQKDFIDNFAVWAEESILPDPNRVLLFDFHTANSHFKKDFVNRVKMKFDWEERIAERLSRVFPLVKGASVKIDDAPGKREDGAKSGYIQFKDRPRIPVDQFGDGMRHSFKVLACLIALEEAVDEDHPGMFLWEDPELFMHPEALGRLLDEVIEIILHKPIQLFCSTQSLEVLGLLAQSFNTKHKASQKQLRVFRLNLNNGNLDLATFHFRNLYMWIKNGMDPRFWSAVDMPFIYHYHEREDALSGDDI